MKLIPLSNFGKNKGKYFAQVDDEDYEKLSKYKWQVYTRNNNSTCYAVRNVWENGQHKTLRMHRIILGITDRAIYCDHYDHNGLNNQKNNLRKCTPLENSKNSRAHKKGSSKYKGIVYTKNKWVSRIMVNYTQINIGSYLTEQDAAKAYDEAAKKYHGKFANLNFP